MNFLRRVTLILHLMNLCLIEARKNAFSFNFMMKSQKSVPGAFDRQHLGTMNSKESGRYAQHGYGKRVDRAMLFIF